MSDTHRERERESERERKRRVLRKQGEATFVPVFYFFLAVKPEDREDDDEEQTLRWSLRAAARYQLGIS